MKISDIRRIKFQTTYLGYRPREVECYMNRLSDRVEEILRENRELKKKSEDRDQTIAETKAREGELTDTIAMVQNAIGGMKSSAQKEGELMIYQGGIRAEETVRAAEQVVVRLRGEILNLQRQKEAALAETQTLIQGFGRVLGETIKMGEKK